MKAWFLAGPTATGKSVVAHLIAKEIGAAILCADAMTVYRGMDIGTAKPDAAMRSEVPYYGIDLVDPCETFSVGAFIQTARLVAAEADLTGRPLIVVGGTGLYLSALLFGLEKVPPHAPEERQKWEDLYAREGIPGLQAALRERDPDALESLADPRNPRRLIRALEVSGAGCRFPRRWKDMRNTQPICALRMDGVFLKRRILDRTHKMLAHGLLDEASEIRSRFPALSRTARQAIGYQEAFAILDGTLSREEAVKSIVSRTWKLARKQMTWFRHQLQAEWVDVSTTDSPRIVADRVLDAWNRHGPCDLHV